MKRLISILTSLLLCASAQAALTMTTSIDELDAWQAVTAATAAEGTADSISDSYATILYIEMAIIEAVENAGVEFIIEISYADDNWTKLAGFSSIKDTPATTQTA